MRFLIVFGVILFNAFTATPQLENNMVKVSNISVYQYFQERIQKSQERSLKNTHNSNGLLIGVENRCLIIYDLEKDFCYNIVEIPILKNSKIIVDTVSKTEASVIIYDQNMWIEKNKRIDYEYTINLEDMKITKQNQSIVYYYNGNYFIDSNLKLDSVGKKQISEKEFLKRTIGDNSCTYYLDKGKIINIDTKNVFIDNQSENKKYCGFTYFNQSYDQMWLIGEYTCWRYSEKNIISPVEIVMVEISSKKVLYTGIIGVNPQLSHNNRYILYEKEKIFHVFDFQKSKNMIINKNYTNLIWLS